MNYRQETYILLSRNAVEKLDPKTAKILYGDKSEHITLTDGTKVFESRWLTLDEDKTVTGWLDTLDGDSGETFEVIARGDGIEEIEHFSNKLGGDRLSVEFRVKADGIDLDEAVPEGGD